MGLVSRLFTPRPKVAAEAISAPQRLFGMSAPDREHRAVTLRRRVWTEHPGFDMVPVEQAFPGWHVRSGDYVILDLSTNSVVAGDDEGQSLSLDMVADWLSDPITDVEAAAARLSRVQ